MPYTLAVDFGARYVGIALVQHPEARRNRVLYAATLVVGAKPLNALVETRAEVRRLRRTRKTHRRRLRRLAQALAGIPGAKHVLRFCRRRGYSHDAEGEDDATAGFHAHRSAFFQALREEIARRIDPPNRDRVFESCSRHLNEDCRRAAEPRPARFENRGPSRCNWEGCRQHVPRADNAHRERLLQALGAWLAPVAAESADRSRLRRSLDYWAGRLDALARSLRKATDAAARRAVAARVRHVYKQLLDRVRKEAAGATAEKFRQDWKDHYRRAVSDVVRGRQGGRIPYCRQHAGEFVNRLWAGEVVPTRADLTESDLVSRKQQIVFRRLWRLVEARLLPLAGGRIDRVVVERVAFDVLAGPLKKRLELSQQKAADIYRQGPLLGFADRHEMLAAEFAGLCAYCGRPGVFAQVEHLLPQSAFPFDSYFNILPACAECNARKGACTALEAGLTVHDDAYRAYSDYVRQRRPVPHVYHTIKKGLLNLLRRPATTGEAERRVGMLANDLVTVAATQRSPRPLARYLASKLAARTRHRPEIAFRAGRHTALYRSAALPEYDKKAPAEDLRNHAVDAVVLACDFPAATALENRNWGLGAQRIHTWFDQVRFAAPATVGGLPRVEPVRFLPYFEEDLGDGYCVIDLSAFNWNRGRKATHMLDPFGVTADGRPLKREPAADVLKDLRDAKKRARRIELVAHAGLRTLLQADPVRAPERLVEWLQGSVRTAAMGDHPSDRARRQLLERFAAAPVEKVISGEEAIPPTIGIRCLNPGSQNKLGVLRAGKDGRVFQRYQAQPVVREMYVGYRADEGGVDRERPVLLTVTQSYEVVRRGIGALPADGPLAGRPHGAREPLKAFLARWREAFAAFSKVEGLAEVHRITQGCVVEKEGGQRLQFRNFDKGEPWMHAVTFKHIRRVYRSPLKVMESDAGSNPPTSPGGDPGSAG